MNAADTVKLREVLETSVALIEESASTLNRAVGSLSEQTASPAEWMVVRTNDFVSRSVRSVLLLLRENFPAQACVVLRSAYEATIRLLWAVRMEKGWDRTRLYWATEDLKWSKDAAENASTKAHAGTIGTERTTFISFVDSKLKDLKLAPGLRQMLQDLETADIEAGIVPAHSKAFLHHYAVYYRVLSGITHGHPVMMRDLPMEAVLGYVAIVTAHITQTICLANDLYAPVAFAAARDDIGERIVAIWTVIDAVGLAD